MKATRLMAILMMTLLLLAGNNLPTLAMTTSDYEAAVSIVQEALRTGSTTKYDFSAYKMGSFDFARVYNEATKREIVAYFSYYNIASEYTFGSDGTIDTFYLRNIDSGFSSRYAQMTAEVAHILSGVDDTMTDLEKIMYVHDYLAYTASYDKSTPLSIEAFYPYGITVLDQGVCDSYAKTMVMLLTKMGIHSQYILSTSMDHSWIMVEVNGSWYQMDPTWDDPTGLAEGYTDYPGRVFHDFALRTDSEFKSGLIADHYGWSTSRTATNTAFSNWFVHDVTGRLWYVDGLWYYVSADGNIAYSNDLTSEDGTLIQGGTDVMDTIYSVEAYGDGFIYSQGNTIRYADKNGNNTMLLATLPEMSIVKYMQRDNDDLTLTVMTYQDPSVMAKVIDRDIQVVSVEALLNGTGVEVLAPVEVVVEEPIVDETVVDETTDPTATTGVYNIVSYMVSEDNSSNVLLAEDYDNNTKVVLDMAITKSNNYSNILESYATSSNRLVIRQESTKGLYDAYGWYNGVVYKPEVEEHFTLTQDANATYINGTLVRKATKQNIDTNAGLKVGMGQTRLYGVTIYNNGTLVKEYLPATGENGVIGLFDTLTGEFIEAKGSFQVGPILQVWENDLLVDITTDTSKDTLVEDTTTDPIIEDPVVETPVEETVVDNTTTEETVDTTTDTANDTATESATDTTTENTTGSTGMTTLDYLEITSSSSRFDTGVLVDSDIKVTLDMAITDNVYDNFLEATNSSSNRLVFRMESTRGLYVAYGWYNGKVADLAIGDRLTITQDGRDTYINGSLVRSASAQTFDTGTSLLIGTAKSKLYGVKIWKNGQLVRNYQPVIDENGIECLYDSVYNQYLYN